MFLAKINEYQLKNLKILKWQIRSLFSRSSIWNHFLPTKGNALVAQRFPPRLPIRQYPGPVTLTNSFQGQLHILAMPMVNESLHIINPHIAPNLSKSTFLKLYPDSRLYLDRSFHWVSMHIGNNDQDKINYQTLDLRMHENVCSFQQ